MKDIEFGLMPTFIGTVAPSVSRDNDLFHPMLWGKHVNGTYGVNDLPDFSDIYINQHNEPVGKIWINHHQSFAEFILKQTNISPDRALEIGPGSGALLANLIEHRRKFEFYDTIDPNPLSFQNLMGQKIYGIFPKDLNRYRKYTRIIHSHLIEHVPDVVQFLCDCNDLLEIGGTMNFSLPNMREMAKNFDLNILMFEHVTFLPLEEISSLLTHTGFEITKIENYLSHSIFISARKVKPSRTSTYTSSISPNEFILLAKTFKSTLVNFVKSANKFLSRYTTDNYLFGAHIFSQYLIAMGLDSKRFNCILDNSELKSNKRLYGTDLISKKPMDMNFSSDARIVLAAGQYEDEILSGLKRVLPSGAGILSRKHGEIRI
jgi:hypothetical protein